MSTLLPAIVPYIYFEITHEDVVWTSPAPICFNPGQLAKGLQVCATCWKTEDFMGGVGKKIKITDIYDKDKGIISKQFMISKYSSYVTC